MPRSVPPPAWVLTQRRRVGKQLRAARVNANLTQQDISERTGIDRNTYGRMELGAASPLLDSLILVADAIGVPLADLVRQ